MLLLNPENDYAFFCSWVLGVFRMARGKKDVVKNVRHKKSNDDTPEVEGMRLFYV